MIKETNKKREEKSGKKEKGDEKESQESSSRQQESSSQQGEAIFWPLVFGVAAFVDLLSVIANLIFLIPFVGWILGFLMEGSISIFAGLGFWLFFYLKGHKGFWKGSAGTTIVEMIPILSVFPTWIAFTLGAYAIIKLGRIPLLSKILKKAKIPK